MILSFVLEKKKFFGRNLQKITPFSIPLLQDLKNKSLFPFY